METTKNFHNPHCENCGSGEYEDLHCGDQGYTACCNENVCRGGRSDRFGDDTTFVTACCWAAAEVRFEQLGIEIPEPAWRHS